MEKSLNPLSRVLPRVGRFGFGEESNRNARVRSEWVGQVGRPLFKRNLKD